MGDHIFSAVMAMKEAVNIAITHGDIRPDAVCRGVGMSTSQLTQWLNSSSQSVQWDTRVAEWLKRTQGEAAERASSGPKPKAAGGASSAKSSARGGGGGGSGGGAASNKSNKSEASESKALVKLKEDLAELENYIPWNAVVGSWDGKRLKWASKLRDSTTVQEVAVHLLALEGALVSKALEASWQESRDEWASDVGKEGSAHKVRHARARTACLPRLPCPTPKRGFPNGPSPGAVWRRLV